MSEPVEVRNNLAGSEPNRPEPARLQSYEMGDNSEEDAGRADAPAKAEDEYEVVSVGVKGYAKHTLGLFLLACVVCLWTMCNFLGSSIFADNTYAKPFFLTYLNTSTFMLAMVPSFVSSAYNLRKRKEWQAQLAWLRDRYHRGGWKLVLAEEEADSSEDEGLLAGSDDEDDNDIRISNSALPGPKRRPVSQRQHLAFFPTAWLSFKFCILWFLANYFAMACLQHTSVASATIFSSTSSAFTLLFGRLLRTDKFTFRKFLAVVASLCGIFLVSRTDLGFDGRDINFSGDPANGTPVPQGTRAADLIPLSGSFPEKSTRETIIGDGFALFSAFLYGLYTIVLKKVSISALPLKLNMPLFFGLVGAFSFLLLWPLLPLLHFTGVEHFELPPTQRIWTILLINSVSSLVSDICWAYAMLLTSPLVVTVGLSLTIPLSLIGEMFIQGRFESMVYWVGSLFVVGSFVFIDKEETREGREMTAALTWKEHRERCRDDDRTKWQRWKDLGRHLKQALRANLW